MEDRSELITHELEYILAEDGSEVSDVYTFLFRDEYYIQVDDWTTSISAHKPIAKILREIFDKVKPGVYKTLKHKPIKRKY